MGRAGPGDGAGGGEGQLLNSIVVEALAGMESFNHCCNFHEIIDVNI